MWYHVMSTIIYHDTQKLENKLLWPEPCSVVVILIGPEHDNCSSTRETWIQCIYVYLQEALQESSTLSVLMSVAHQAQQHNSISPASKWRDNTPFISRAFGVRGRKDGIVTRGVDAVGGYFYVESLFCVESGSAASARWRNSTRGITSRLPLNGNRLNGIAA